MDSVARKKKGESKREAFEDITNGAAVPAPPVASAKRKRPAVAERSTYPRPQS